MISKDKDSSRKSKFVLQFYLLAYGISLVICGINLAVSHEQYLTDKM